MRLASFLFVMAFSLAANAQMDPMAYAKSLYLEGRYAESLRVLNTLIEGESDNTDALRLQGDCYQKEEKYVAAIQAYEKAAKQKPDDALLYANWGSAFINLEQYGEAEKRLKKALKTDNELPEAHYYMGNVKYFDFRVRAAIQCYDEAIRLRPTYRDALYMRAASYAELDRPDLALRDYQAALDLDPKLETARYNIAVLHLREKDYGKAVSLLQKIDVDALSNTADYYFSLGEALFYVGESEASCEAYQEAMQLGDKESREIYKRYCLDKEEREAQEQTRTIRMAF